MKQSLTYYITLFIIKLKRLKKDFSKDPIDFKKIRNNNILKPKSKFFKENIVQNFKVLNASITEISRHKNANNLLLFIHGGAFISGPSKHHWDTIKEIVKQTNHAVWMCDYPKAPENKISDISRHIDAIYNSALKRYQPYQIAFIGDSAGGTLIAALTQRLIKRNIELPLKIILISPVMDAAMSNPDIEKVDPVDPMLSRIGVLSAKTMCAENNDLKSAMISPIHGSFDKFPRTVLFLAENDITYPDQKIVVQKLIKAKADVTVIEGKNMPHIWPLLPVMKEAKTALKKIILELKSSEANLKI